MHKSIKSAVSIFCRLKLATKLPSVIIISHIIVQHHTQLWTALMYGIKTEYREYKDNKSPLTQLLCNQINRKIASYLADGHSHMNST